MVLPIPSQQTHFAVFTAMRCTVNLVLLNGIGINRGGSETHLTEVSPVRAR